LSANATVSASYVANVFGSDLQVKIGAEQFSVKLSAAGEHNVLNALAAIACTHAIGVPNAVIAQGLEAFAPVNGRLQRKQAIHGAAVGATVIDDTYNANPDSVRAAIDVLAKLGGKSILVLGDMGEVGSEGVAFHEEIGAYAHQRGIATMFTLGELAQHASTTFGANAQHFNDIESLFAALNETLSASDTVLVKGSRFMKMERVVSYLTTAPISNQTQTGTH
jgi:UDP-N-acetylmuramoyl-tripeptide--D-alanyl-D-alanine ligase